MCQRYLPFITWNEKELQNELLELIDKCGIPVYPKDVTEYPIVGNTLGEWLKALEDLVKGDTGPLHALSVSVETKLPLSVLEPRPYFFIYGVYRELIEKQKNVLQEIWEKQRIREEKEKLETEGALLSVEECSYIEELEDKYNTNIILVGSEDDAKEYMDLFGRNSHTEEVEYNADITLINNADITLINSAGDDTYDFNYVFDESLFEVLILRDIVDKMRRDPDFAVKYEQIIRYPMFASREEMIKARARKDPLSGEIYLIDFDTIFIRDDGSVKIWEKKVWGKNYSLATYEFVFSGTEYLELYLVRKTEYDRPLCYNHEIFYGENYGFSPADVEVSYIKSSREDEKVIMNETLLKAAYPVVYKEEDGETIWRILLDDRSVIEWEAVRFNQEDRYLKTRFHAVSRGV